METIKLTKKQADYLRYMLRNWSVNEDFSTPKAIAEEYQTILELGKKLKVEV